MSAREEQPVTLPPPPGEDDAYSATTKVGAMPAEVLARLRAEGLMPEEPEVVSGPPPASSLEPRPQARSVPRPLAAWRDIPAIVLGESEEETEEEESAVPLLYSTAPPPVLAAAPEVAFKPPLAPVGSARPSNGPADVTPTFLTPSTPPFHPQPSTPPLGMGMGTTTDTPIAFAFPPPSSASPSAFASPSAGASGRPVGLEYDAALRDEIRSFGGRRLSKVQTAALLIAGMLLLVLFAFAMALMSQRG